MVDVFGEGGTRVEEDTAAAGLPVVGVADFVYLFEDGGEGVGRGEAGAMSDLSVSARVVDMRGHGANALLVSDDVVDERADVAVELGGYWVV